MDGCPYVETSEVNGIIEARLHCDSILDELVIRDIGTALQGAVEGRETPQMIVDFTGVEHLSSSALGMLITLNNRAREAGGELCLASIADPILDVFRITKLDGILDIFDTTADAHAAAQR